jgi:hypothetical protein
MQMKAMTATKESAGIEENECPAVHARREWMDRLGCAFLRRNSTERRDGQDRNRRTENREDDSTVEHEVEAR